MKKSLLSLALAGSLSASQLFSYTQELKPQNTAQKLNQEARLIKNSKTRALTEEQIEQIAQSVDAMMSVNERTYSDFLPALEASFQKLAKEDKELLSQSLKMMKEFLDIRLKQYANISKALKSTNIPNDILENISKMEKLSREAKKIISNHEKNLHIYTSIESYLGSLEDVKIKSFWVPEFKEKSVVLVKVEGIDEDDFDAMDKATDALNAGISSPHIEAIMVA